MKEKVFMLIDELVAMSESNYSPEGLSLELSEIEKKISNTKKSIKKFESSMDDSKYFNISLQMMDRNIEVTLNKKIKEIKNSIEELDAHITESSNNEKKVKEQLEKVEKNIEEYEKLLSILNSKLETIKNKDTKKVYKDIIDNTTNSLNKHIDQKDSLTLENEELEKSLEMLKTSKQELEEKMQQEKEKLANTKHDLANEKNYYNYNLKKEDEEYLDSLKEGLEKLENEKLAILTDPANLANEAKKLITDNKSADAISKIKELVSVIEDSSPIKESDTKKLNELKEQALADLENKKNEIAEKDYKTDENNVLESRVADINSIIENLEKNSANLKETILEIDTKSVVSLKLEIEETQESKETVEKSLEELEELKKDNNASSLYTSIITYEKELSSIDKVINKQTEDLEYYVNLSSDLESIVEAVDKKINEKKKEIEQLEKNISLKSKLTDEKKRLKDEEELKALEKNVKDIDKKIRIKRSPKEIYNEIDCLLGSLDFDEPIKRVHEPKPLRKQAKNLDEKSKKIKIINIDEEDNEPIESEPSPNIDIDFDKMGFEDIVSLLGDK